MASKNESSILISHEPSICPYCGCGCKIVLEERKGKLRAKSAGEKSLNKKFLCIKGNTVGDYICLKNKIRKLASVTKIGEIYGWQGS